MRAEGKSDDEIRMAALEMKIKSVEKYGNRSKVGLEIEVQNEKLLSEQKNCGLMQELKSRKQKIRNASEFNKATIRTNELNKLRN